MSVVKAIIAWLIRRLVTRRPRFLSDTIASVQNLDKGAFDRFIKYRLQQDAISIANGFRARWRSTEDIPAEEIDAAVLLISEMVRRTPEAVVAALTIISRQEQVLTSTLLQKLLYSSDLQAPIHRAIGVHSADPAARAFRDSVLLVCLTDPRLPSWSREFGRLLAISELHGSWGRIKQVVATNTEGVEDRWRESCAKIQNRHQVQDLLLDTFERNGRLLLSKSEWEFPDRRSMWCLINEILIEEEYYFEADTPQPRIIDAGAHCGLAIYYFKSLYPSCSITAFEPDPRLREMALRNIQRAEFCNVECLPYALAGKRGIARFHISVSDSMAGSVEHGTQENEFSEARINVETVTLSDYLVEPIDMLKLDIEGEELSVLKEVGTKLSVVRNVFCEFHYRPDSAQTLGAIVEKLESAGHVVRVSQSWSTRARGTSRPLSTVGETESMIIWGRNLRKQNLLTADE